MPPERRSLASCHKPELRCPETLVTSSRQRSGESQKNLVAAERSEAALGPFVVQTTGIQGGLYPSPPTRLPCQGRGVPCAIDGMPGRDVFELCVIAQSPGGQSPDGRW
ncbi:MAG: hypothetical protein RLZZ536_3287 [Planctomycetota bacterium]